MGGGSLKAGFINATWLRGPHVSHIGQIHHQMLHNYYPFGVPFKDAFQVNILSSSNTERKGKPRVPEYLMCEMQQSHSLPVLIYVIYGAPEISFENDTDFIDKLRTYSLKFICGLASELSLQIS